MTDRAIAGNIQREPARASKGHRLRVAGAAVVLLAALLMVANWPVSTSAGYNYVVTTRRLTLLEKAIWFIDRDLQMQRIKTDIAGTQGTPEERLVRMYEWVSTQIHPVPPGMPIIDDHVSYIFVRRYGADDQRAEALAALASYDGMPSTALGLAKAPKMRGVVVTIVRVGGRLLIFDVNNHVAFRRQSGELATLDDLKRDASLIERAGNGLRIDGVPYHEHFQHLRDTTPTFLRMEDQRPWPRLKHELSERLHAWTS